jgi:hypothetical protein
MTIQKPMIKSHKPLHKPKTYAEQLQDLQPQKTFKGMCTYKYVLIDAR